MSRFYVEMKGGLHAGSATIGRRAHASYGAYATAASYSGAVTVTPYVNADNVDCMRVVRHGWKSSDALTVVLYDGPVSAEHFERNNLVDR